jgi:hypothetical protein
VHSYAPLTLVQDGGIELQMRTLRDYITAHDSAAKPFFLGEVGLITGRVGDSQVYRYDFDYGVWMADLAVQSMRAGMAGASAWDLDDAMHVGGAYGELDLKGWGFWNSYAGSHAYPTNDINVRPWFGTWSVLARSIPRRSQILRVSATPLPGVRATAAAVPAKRGRDLTFVVVNDADTPRTVRVATTGSRARTRLVEYRYFAGDRRVNADGLPLRARTIRGANLMAGIDVSLPSKGVVVLTTRGGGGTPPLTGAIKR